MIRLSAWILIIYPLISFGEQDVITNHPNWKLVNPAGCGITSSDRIVGGNDAPIGAFPWVARLGYAPIESPHAYTMYSCGGAIINKLYVVTAAHCIVSLPNNLTLARVRLGEHDVSTNPDCEDSFCNLPYEEHDVDEAIAHERYDDDSNKNDIGIVRVKGEITFNYFVKPICMVKERSMDKDFTGKLMEVAGWGVYNISDPKPSIALQAIKLPVHPVSRCANEKYYEEYSIDSTQLCLGGTVGRDSCVGDSGGPVMKMISNNKGDLPRIYLLGVVSFGPPACGVKSLPSIYINVLNYTSWILDHLKA